ncbi:MAG: NADH-quinone oxidoreductase subunit NuoG [Alphaproteobacteria bacterium]|nr:NADH-quinone oxidoreductase subunit NuoG [Alphaproteobacteria bacterium]
MTKLIVDGKEIEVPPDFTLLQACEAAGAEIPRFCYHERLSIAGNCRMCLVELKGSPKPVASCAWGVRDCRPGPNGEPPVINTASPMVKKAREGVMEFLLINHPLDCPICDQGGECDLQDQAMAYGHANFNRYDENKRAVTDKYMGPLINTSMNRCIHCTRCVRFAAEVAGVDDIGATGRGEDMEITTYLEKALSSELSGNVIDLCPVGALTSKPYKFNARPWELTKTDSIDVMDAVGSAIRVDTRGREVMRFLPRVNEEVNEEWISDKTRFVWDGLRRQRLDTPYIRKGGKLQPATWYEALAVIADRFRTVRPERMAALVGDLVSTEAVKALKDLMVSLGVASLDCRQDGAKLGHGPRQGYLFNTTIAGIETADALLLVGSNPRWEAPIINARIRKAWLRNDLKIMRMGPLVDLTYRVTELDNNPADLADIAAGKHSAFDVLRNAKNPMLILGQGALTRPDGAAILAACAQIARNSGMIGPAGDGGWNGFNVLHTAAARVGALDVGFVPHKGGKDTVAILDAASRGEMDFIYLLGADEIDMNRLGKAFVVYQGTHGDAGAHRADLVLPGATYTEQHGTYVNTEGRVQLSKRANFPPGEAREDWTILRALSDVVGKKLPYDDLNALRQAMLNDAPSWTALDRAPTCPGADAPVWASIGIAGTIANAPFEYGVKDFYLTNPIARASQVMAECSALFVKPRLAAAAE